MNDYIIRYADGVATHVRANDIDTARAKGYRFNRSSSIASIDKV
jgi:hypothetical protein